MKSMVAAAESSEEDKPPLRCTVCGRPIEVTFSVMLKQACPACGAVIEEDLCTDDIGELFS